MKKEKYQELIDTLLDASFELTEDQKIILVNTLAASEKHPTYSNMEKTREFVRDLQNLTIN